MARSALPIRCLPFAAWLWALPGHSATVRVPADRPTLQAAVDAAGDGDTVLLAAGTYRGTGNFNVRWDASSKHLVIRSAGGPDRTVIDCEWKGRAFILDGGQTDKDAIQGLTLTRGYVSSREPEVIGGGAILIDGGSPRIEDCRLVYNVAGDSLASTRNSYWADGGAIDCIRGARPTIRRNRIERNFASHTGGGIHFDKGTGGLVENNIITHNQNNGCYGGGGIALIGGAAPDIIGNQITWNAARYYWKGGFGGGIICMNSAPRILFNTLAFNSTVNGDSIGEGGGIRIRGLPAPSVEGNILWGNVGAVRLADLDFQYPQWALDLRYNIVQGGIAGIAAPERATNLDANPLFADPAGGDFRLRAGSPAIDAGPAGPAAGLPPRDALGNLRVTGGRVDLGAYEAQGPSGVRPPPARRRPDGAGLLGPGFDAKGRTLGREAGRKGPLHPIHLP